MSTPRFVLTVGNSATCISFVPPEVTTLIVDPGPDAQALLDVLWGVLPAATFRELCMRAAFCAGQRGWLAMPYQWVPLNKTEAVKHFVLGKNLIAPRVRPDLRYAFAMATDTASCIYPVGSPDDAMFCVTNKALLQHWLVVEEDEDHHMWVPVGALEPFVPVRHV